MKHTKLKVEMYGFKVDVMEAESKDDAEYLARFFRRFGLEDPFVDEIITAISDGDMDGGYTFACYGVKRVFIILLEMSNATRRREVLMHEKRHAEDDILQHCSVKDDEAAAYLAGYLGKYIF